ncbi:MAG: LysM peptidoglycan-binding domain-containing protein [Clostridia bacterium]
MKRRYVLRNKKRFMAISIIILSLVLSSFMITLRPTQSKQQDSYYEVVIVKGDTLWDIASSINHQNQDIRKIVRHIKQINHLESAEIFVGQTIRVPGN